MRIASRAPARCSASTTAVGAAPPASPHPCPRPAFTGYAGTAISGRVAIQLELLEVATAFPVGDDAVEAGPLLAGCVHEVLVHVGPERLDRDLTALELADGIHQRLGHAFEILAGIRVPVVRRARIETVLDAVQAARDRRREREVGVHVGARQPGLD